MMPLTGIVKHLIIINVVVFVSTYLLPPEWVQWLPCYSPAMGMFRPFQIITYMFTHAGVTHILLNMLSLYFLGPIVEMTLGHKRFLGLYMISGLTGLAAHFFMYYLPVLMGLDASPPKFIVLGASGAVFGVVIAFATLYPDRQLMLLFPPIPIRAWVMALILVGIGLYSGFTGAGDNDVAHFAHLGGALAGFVLALHWKRGGGFLR